MNVPERGQWCGECGTNMAHGNAVRLRLGDDSGGRYFCTVCAARHLRCAGCRRELAGAQGRLFSLDDDDRRLYCPACWERPHCHACGHPVGETLYRRPDGRVFCARCHATAIYSPTQAAELYARVRMSAEQELGLTLNVGAALHLSSREQLAALRGTPAPGLAAEQASDAASPDYVGLFVYNWRTRAIYVEYGLPRIMFCEVAAHEYAHAWQMECAPLLSDPELREGFAEWVAYRVMASWGCTRRLARLRNRQDMYGSGLRRLLAWEAEAGPAGVLERIRSER